jgi:glycerol-3-phosphate acyltransferase PlsY
VVAGFVIGLGALGAYLLGSIPTGVLVARVRGVDLRTVGSGNIGATNATRALGRALGAVVLVGDLIKGLVPTLLARELGMPAIGVAAIGFAAFLGHLFPLYLRFRGGKGVATAAGIFFAMAPGVMLVTLGVWLLVLAASRVVSIASLAASLTLPIGLAVMQAPTPMLVCAITVLALVVWKHRGNIERLWKRRSATGEGGA